MQLSWNEEQLNLREQYQTFGEKITERAKQCYARHEFDHQSWQELADEGIWRLAVPREYGGEGRTWWEFSAAVEGLATTIGDLGFLLSMIAHIGCIRVLMMHGTEEQKQSYLPVLLSGAVGATAITEPSGGSDVARITTSAVSKNGQYVLNGQKAHITNAPVADIIVMVGRIPELGQHDITLFLLERTFDGMSFAEAEHMLGNHTSPTGDIFLRDVTVDELSILGQPGNGLNILYNMISLDRVLYGLVGAAFMEPILANSLEFSFQRQAFKTQIANHQYVQAKLTDMKMGIESSRWISYAALDKLIRNDDEASLMCSLAKYVGTENLFEVLQHAMQLKAHSGYMMGEIAQMFCDVTGTRIAGGTSDIQRVNMFNQMKRHYEARSNACTSELVPK